MANTYVAIHNSDHEKWNSYSSEARKAIEVLNLFNIRPMRALILATAQQFSKEEATKVFRFCVSLGVRLMIAGSTRTGSVEERLADAANKIYVGEITSTEMLIEYLEQMTPSNDLFESKFATATVSNSKLARYYLRSLEMQAKDEKEPWLVPNDDRSVINLEHILPEKPEGNWPQFSGDQVKLYYKRIGNFVLLLASENSSLKSAAFDEKKIVYAKSPYVLTEQVSRFTVWADAGISE